MTIKGMPRPGYRATKTSPVVESHCLYGCLCALERIRAVCNKVLNKVYF